MFATRFNRSLCMNRETEHGQETNYRKDKKDIKPPKRHRFRFRNSHLCSISLPERPDSRIRGLSP